MTEVSAFKQLYSEMIKNGGDWNAPKKTIKCYVKESFPHFLVTDGYFYVACYFTKKAVDEFRSRYASMNITDLRSRVITISDWSLEMNRVNSANVFTSYGGVECRLIVKSFKPVLQEKDQPTLTRHPVNLFRDDEIKTLIQHYTHSCIAKSVKDTGSLPDISRMSAKGGVGQGVHSFASGANFSGFTFKEGKTSTVDMNAIFKMEKGADALRRLQSGAGSTGRAKVVGGPKRAAKGKGKSGSGIGSIVEKIQKFTPGDKRSAAAKKSTARIGGGKAPTMMSPGDKHAGTTDHQSMRDFQRMVNFLKNKKISKGKGSTARTNSGKKSKK
jgi:hypothetical protein